MRRGLFAFALAFLIAPSAVPSASAYDGLTVTVLTSPPLQGGNETISFEVFVFLWDAAVDPDNVTLEVRVPIGSFLANVGVPLLRVSIGHYSGNYTFGPQPSGPLEFKTWVESLSQIHATAKLGTRFDSALYDYERGIHDYSKASPGWSWTTHAYGPRGASLHFLAGDTVTLRMSAHRFGMPVDGLVLHPALSWGPGTLAQNLEGDVGGTQPVPTRVGVGQYEVIFTIPSDLTVTHHYQLAWVPGSYWGEVDLVFYGHPFLASYTALRTGSTSFGLDVVAGSQAPTSGAQVELTGETFHSESPYSRPIGPLKATLDARSRASFAIDVEPDYFAEILVNVSHGGRTVFLEGFVLNELQGPVPPNSDRFAAELATDVSTFSPGDEAYVGFQLFYQNHPLGNAPVAAVVSRQYYGELQTRAGPSMALNLSTDSEGRVGFPYSIAHDWTPEQRLSVQFVSPHGKHDSLLVRFGGQKPQDWSRFVEAHVTGNRSDEPLQVSALTDFPAHWDFETRVVSARAYLLASEDLSNGLPRSNGLLAAGELLAAGGTWSGALVVPAWLPSGNYTWVVAMTVGVANPYQYYELEVVNASMVYLESHYVAPTSAGAGWALPLLLIATAAAAGVAAIAWRVLRAKPR